MASVHNDTMDAALDTLRREIEDVTRWLPANVDCGGVWAALDAIKAELTGAVPLHESLVQADAVLTPDEQRHIGIGKAIERACAELPEEAEIIVSLENGAGTVTLIDQDGYENDNFYTDCGLAGALNEAIDAAIAAQANQGGV